MSRKNRRHLAAVPKTQPADRPTPVGFPVTIEIPTGGRNDVDGLVRELARVAFRSTLSGYEVKADGPRVRCFVTVQPTSAFDGEAIELARRGILGALVAVGVLKLKPQPAVKEEPGAPSVAKPPTADAGAPEGG